MGDGGRGLVCCKRENRCNTSGIFIYYRPWVMHARIARSNEKFLLRITDNETDRQLEDGSTIRSIENPTRSFPRSSVAMIEKIRIRRKYNMRVNTVTKN